MILIEWGKYYGFGAGQTTGTIPGTEKYSYRYLKLGIINIWIPSSEYKALLSKVLRLSFDDAAWIGNHESIIRKKQQKAMVKARASIKDVLASRDAVINEKSQRITELTNENYQLRTAIKALRRLDGDKP